MLTLFAQNFPGMGYFYLSLLVLCLAILLSLVALGTACFSRLGAKIVSGLVICLIPACLSFLLAGNSRGIAALPDVLVAIPGVAVLVGAVFLITAIASFVPLTRNGSAGCQATKVTRNRWLVGTFVGLPILVLIGFEGVRYADRSRGESMTRALLAGDKQVRFERVQIDYGQCRVVCTDSQVLRYLEERFRQHDPEHRDTGGLSQLTLQYEGGGSHTIFASWHEGGLSLALAEHEDGGYTHGVLLPRPLPGPIQEIAAFLNRPTEEVQGKVLVISPEGRRYDYDRSLIARFR
jgi:hypothetical protein